MDTVIEKKIRQPSDVCPSLLEWATKLFRDVLCHRRSHSSFFRQSGTSHYGNKTINPITNASSPNLQNDVE